MLDVCFDRARGMFQPCSKYVPTVHEVGFDRRLRYISTVLRDCFDRVRLNFDRARVSFDHA